MRLALSGGLRLFQELAQPSLLQVAEVDANGKIQFENVVIARDNGSLVELASGVQPGDRLVLNISSQIAPGQTVAVNEPDAASKPLGAKR